MVHLTLVKAADRGEPEALDVVAHVGIDQGVLSDTQWTSTRF